MFLTFYLNRKTFSIIGIANVCLFLNKKPEIIILARLFLLMMIMNMSKMEQKRMTTCTRAWTEWRSPAPTTRATSSPSPSFSTSTRRAQGNTYIFGGLLVAFLRIFREANFVSQNFRGLRNKDMKYIIIKPIILNLYSRIC